MLRIALLSGIMLSEPIAKRLRIFHAQSGVFAVGIAKCWELCEEREYVEQIFEAAFHESEMV